MKYGFFFTLTATMFLVAALAWRGWYWLAIWPGISFGNIAVGYCWQGAKVFGKRPDGSIGGLLFCINLPYLLLIWILWHAMRAILRENPYDRVCAKIFVGRRLSANELPDGIDMVVDLTCEFIESRKIRAEKEYWSFPILDGSTPDPDDFLKFITKIAHQNGSVYIHCAQGHGRTGLVAAGVLVAKGLAGDANDALMILQSSRKGIALNSIQRAFMIKYLDHRA